MTSKRDVITLLRRAAAAIETPDDLILEDRDDLIDDLCICADDLEANRYE